MRLVWDYYSEHYIIILLILDIKEFTEWPVGICILVTGTIKAAWCVVRQSRIMAYGVRRAFKGLLFRFALLFRREAVATCSLRPRFIKTSFVLNY